jgi:hypothetical protein
MTTNFPFIAIPDEFACIMGVVDEGTRIFRAEGNHEEMQRWFDALCQHIGPSVSPGGAAVYAGVSRAGVYKRMKTGGLSAFCFHITGKKKTIFGGEKKLKELPLVYIPVSECKAWGAELEERGARIEANRGTAEDETALDEADPEDNDANRDPGFVHFDPKDKGRRDVKYMTWTQIERPEESNDGN